MESFILFIFFIVLTVIVFNGKLQNNEIIQPTLIQNSTFVKPQNQLYNLLKQYSSGDKLYLGGECQVNLYSKYIIPVDLKEKFTKLLNNIFISIYGITNQYYEVQEFNNIYEQIDSFNNKRYIIDATLNSVKKYYTSRIILDIVIINDEIFVNFISLNNASNNNIMDRYDVVFQDQGVLFNHNNFTSNVRSLLDQEYREKYRLISFKSKYLDSKNYDLNNVLSLKSLLKTYVPSKFSVESQNNFEMKGILGQYESYAPPDIPMIQSPQFCNKYNNDWTSDGTGLTGNESCIFDQKSTLTEYNQPYMGPGLFFNRSSYPKDL